MTAILALVALTACDRGARPAFVGRPAPVFTLQEGGRTVALGSLRGRVVVLNFWATWCPPCITELPSLVAMQKQLQDKVTVLAVSADESESAYRDFLQKRDLSALTLVRDGAQKSNALYGTFRFPETYVIDKSGIVRRKFIGPVEWTSPEVLDFLTRLSLD